MNQTVVGYFDSRTEAQKAVGRLEAAGFPAGSARISDEAPSDLSTRADMADGSSGRVTSGTDTHPDSGMLSGIREFFSDVFGHSHERLSDYEEAVKRGGTVVKVSASSDDELARATDILEEAGAVDIDERAIEWRRSSDTTAGAASPSSGAAAYPGDADYVDTYRSDYDTRYASLGGSYDDYEPAYRYGHSIANEQSYTGRDWEDLEPTLKSDWSSKNPDSPWEKVKDGIKHAWHVAKG